MADQKTANKKATKTKLNKKRLNISATAVIDNIVFSKSEKWAYYRLSNTVYDFLSRDEKITRASQLINAFVNLLADRQEPLPCHLIVTSIPLDVDSWESQVRKVSEDWNRSPGFDRYVRETAAYLENEQYMKKVTYLGVYLGKRGELDLSANAFVENGFRGAVDTFKTWMNTAMKLDHEEISIHDEKEARRQEENIYRTLSTGNLNASRCTAEELLLLMKRQMYPCMPAPYLDVDHGNRLGPGDLDLELTSAIHNKLRWLEISQMLPTPEGLQEVTGCRAVLSISSLPKRVDFPDSFPFMYLMNKQALPFPIYARFSLHPTAAMKKKLEKKKKEQKDELENLAAGGNTVDAAVGVTPTDVTEALADMQLLNEMLAHQATPWVEGSYRVVIETPDEESLKKFVAFVKSSFTDQDINLTWTVGDQADLFLEQMPGDRLRGSSHNLITDLVMFGTSGFVYSEDIGDLVFGSDAGESMGAN